jgi:hypothetical protein
VEDRISGLEEKVDGIEKTDEYIEKIQMEYAKTLHLPSKTKPTNHGH